MPGLDCVGIASPLASNGVTPGQCLEKSGLGSYSVARNEAARRPSGSVALVAVGKYVPPAIETDATLPLVSRKTNAPSPPPPSHTSTKIGPAEVGGVEHPRVLRVTFPVTMRVTVCAEPGYRPSASQLSIYISSTRLGSGGALPAELRRHALPPSCRPPSASPPFVPQARQHDRVAPEALPPPADATPAAETTDPSPTVAPHSPEPLPASLAHPRRQPNLRAQHTRKPPVL
jgi:hypothetical protein